MPYQLAHTISDEAVLAHAKREGEEATAAHYNFISWKQLLFFLRYLRGEQPLPDDPAERVLIDGCLSYNHQDDTQHSADAEAILNKHPELVQSSIHHAAVAGDVEAVRSWIARDPESVHSRGGLRDWEPLLYATYSRVTGGNPLEVVRLLLDAGADPNAHFMWGGQYRFSALTAVFGEGEGGPSGLPEHPQMEELAELLLSRGADPNDSQSVYNRMFTCGSRCYEILIAHGLNGEHRCNWLDTDDDGRFIPNQDQTLGYALGWAIEHGHDERARLVIEAGADCTYRDDEGCSRWRLAMQMGKPELAAVIVAHGGKAEELSEADRFSFAVFNGDRETAMTMYAANPSLAKPLLDDQAEYLQELSRTNRLDAMGIMLDFGADPNCQTYCSPLHEAADCGHLEMCKLLIARGAMPSLRCVAYGGTATGWAKYQGHQDVVDFLMTHDHDIFAEIFFDRPERVRALLEADPNLINLRFRELRSCTEEPSEFDWRTPLVSAVKGERRECIEYLLAAGADRNVRSPEGQSIAEFAHEVDPEILALLNR